MEIRVSTSSNTCQHEKSDVHMPVSQKNCIELFESKLYADALVPWRHVDDSQFAWAWSGDGQILVTGSESDLSTMTGAFQVLNENCS